MMIGAGTELIIDEFVFNPEDFEGKITTTIKQGSIKVLSGKISETNPEDLVVKTPAGTIGTRGTEFQALVDDEDGDSELDIYACMDAMNHFRDHSGDDDD